MKRSIDACIVGAGFSGLLSAILIRQHGGTCCIIEKHPIESGSISNAHYLNAYSLEILVEAGLSIDDLRMAAVDDVLDKRMVVCHSLNHTLAQVDLASQSDYADRFSRIGRYGAFLNVRACRLHAMLLDRALDLGVEIRSLHRVLSLDISNHTLLVQNITSNDELLIECDYLVGCDGAESQVAQLSSRFLQSERAFQHFFTVECYGSIRDCVQDAALFYWVYHEKMVACLVNFDIDHLQVLQIPVLPGQGDGLSEHDIRDRFAAILGVPSHQCQHRFKIRGEWALKTAQLDHAVTDNWVYFCGDALHQVLPAGGFGLNLALADVYNLIWKMDIAKQSAHSLARLATYADERIPVAEATIQQSIDNYREFITMATQFMGGADRSLLNLVSTIFPENLSHLLTKSWLRTVRLLHDSGCLSVGWSDVMKKNRTHFDGMSMHYSAKYQGPLIFEPTQRAIYALDRVPHALYVGYRIQSFVCFLDDQRVYLSDYLSYQKWTIVFVSDGVSVPKILSEVIHSFQVLRVGIDDRVTQALPLSQSHCILIRPDRYLAAHVDLTCSDTIRRFTAFCQSLN